MESSILVGTDSLDELRELFLRQRRIEELQLYAIDHDRIEPGNAVELHSVFRLKFIGRALDQLFGHPALGGVSLRIGLRGMPVCFADPRAGAARP